MSTSKRTVHHVPGADFPDWYPSSSVVTAGPFAFTASMSAVDFAAGIVAAASVNPALPLTSGHPVKLQVRETYRRLTTALEAVGSSLADGVSINQWQPTFRGDAVRDESAQNAYLTHWEEWRDVAHAYIQGRDEFLLADRPASCLLPIDRLVAKDSLIEIQLISLLADSGITKRAYSNDVHNPLGGYSVGMEAGPLLFSAGFIPTDFATGLHPNARVPQHIWYGNQVAHEVAETLRQIKVTMEASGADWADVVKIVLYLTPEGMRNLPAVDEVWRANWPDSPPARAIVPVSGIGGVKGGNVEIYVIVARREAGGDREVISTDTALAPIGHQVQAIRSGEFLFLSTQLGRTTDGPLPSALAAETGLPFTRRHVVEQIKAIHADVAAICTAAGTSIENTLKADLYLTDFADLATVFDAWPDPFTEGLPAAGFFEVPPGSLEVPGCSVAADIIVHCPTG